MTAATAPTANEAGQGLREIWDRAWVRWPVYVLVGLVSLQIVEWISSPSTDELVSGNQAGAMLRWATPLLLAGLGGLISERSGIINIGLEGMMILGTWFGAWGSLEYGPVMGTVIGILGGAAGGLLHAVATVGFGVDHIISAVAINIIAPNTARFLADEVFTGRPGGSISQSPRVGSFGAVDLPVLDRVSWLTIFAFASVPIMWFVLWRTRFGLRLRSCGEHPTAADSLGVNVHRYQFAAVITSGGLAGLAGSYLVTEGGAGIYKENLVNGRGFIGLATMIFGNWRPAGTALGSLLFGYTDALQLRDRTAGIHTLLLVGALVLAGLVAYAVIRKRPLTSILVPAVIAAAILVWYLVSDSVPNTFGNVAPHILTLVVLIFLGNRLRPPAEEGKIWRKGDH